MPIVRSDVDALAAVNGVYASADLGFEDWYVDARPTVVAALALWCGSVDAATDATDEAFTRALARWPRVRSMCSPTGWVVTVAMNVARSRARRRAAEENLLRRHRVYESLPAPAGEVFDVVRLLPRQQRTVVLLRYVVDLAAADIADLLGISRSTVSSTLTNAHRRLALLLVDEPLGSPEIGGSDE